MLKLDIVIPFFNEEPCVRVFVERLLAAVSALRDLAIRLILVDDGSSDRTPEILDELSRNDDRICVIHLWGNHGHQRALVAGLDQCAGDMVLMLDGDGQHPLETAVALVTRLRQDPDLGIVQALRRGSQGGLLKNAASEFFYWAANRIMPDVKLRRGASDFRVMRKPVVELLGRYSDRHRNLRVLLASLNLPTAYLEYEVAPRIAGVSRYRFRQMLALATDGWFAFSTSPLRISLMLMFGSAALGLAYLIYSLIVFAQNRTVPGWTSIVALIAFLFSAVFGVLAIMSEYVARIYTDVRMHPIYRLHPGRGPVSNSDGTTTRAGGSR